MINLEAKVFDDDISNFSAATRERLRRILMIWTAQDDLYMTTLPAPSETLDSNSRKAHNEYQTQMGIAKCLWARRIYSIFNDACKCANCIRQVNIRRMGMLKLANSDLRRAHDNIIEDILKMPQFKDATLFLPRFEPFHPAHYVTPRVNPWLVDEHVETWEHNPFDSSYTEPWTPDVAYPWQNRASRAPSCPNRNSNSNSNSNKERR
jgi:hypothetical protein